MKKILFALIALALLAGCTNNDGASKALANAGYTNVELTGYSWLSCSDTDQYSTGFKATGPTGKQVEGVVCSGIFKGATIRTF